MFNNALTWPPFFSIRRTKLARHVTIKVTLQKGLLFVVPFGFNKKKIPDLLKINKNWIQEQLILLYRNLNEIRMSPLPRQLKLTAIRQNWKVKYKLSTSDFDIVENTKQKILTVSGNIKNKSECKKKLNSWVKAHAKKMLLKKLERLSIKIGLKFKDMVIRNQKGYWASCSSQKRISLNYKIVFLPESLCKYIFIHELCHVIQFNHSKKFWHLVSKYDANYKKHNEAMRESEKLIPVWAREF
jgi:predicted metal-dependent hydrolase